MLGPYITRRVHLHIAAGHQQKQVCRMLSVGAGVVLHVCNSQHLGVHSQPGPCSETLPIKTDKLSFKNRVGKCVVVVNAFKEISKVTGH